MHVVTGAWFSLRQRAAELGRMLTGAGLGSILTQCDDRVVAHVHFWNPVSILCVSVLALGLFVLEPLGMRADRRDTDRLDTRRIQAIADAVETSIQRGIDSVGPTLAQGVDYAATTVGTIGAQGSSVPNRVFYVPARAAQDSAVAFDRAGDGIGPSDSRLSRRGWVR